MAVITQTSVDTTTVTVGNTITTAPGTPVVVTNVGTTKDVVLNFEIPGTTSAALNLDGGAANTNYGAIDPIDPGGA